jgi:hypothetical protein
MHITEWKPNDYDEGWKKRSLQLNIAEQYLGCFLINAIEAIEAKLHNHSFIPKYRWIGGPHGEKCKCSGCDNARHHTRYNYHAYGALDVYWDYADRGPRVEISVIDQDGNEGEIEIRDCEACIKHDYALTDIDLIRIIRAKYPLRLGRNIKDERGFFEAFKAGHIPALTQPSSMIRVR